MNGVDYDVIVVGAGTAGCHVARQLKRKGFSVCVFDYNKSTKVDSGIVSHHFFEHLPDRSLITSRIRAIDMVSPNGTKVSVRSRRPFAFSLDRERLGRKARRGVPLAVERFVGCKRHEGWVEVMTDGGCHSCSVLVGADGAMSSVRRELGVEPPTMAWGVLKRGKETRGNVSVYFDKRYSPDGFGWVIPHSGETGLVSSTNPMEHFRRFLSSFGRTATNSKKRTNRIFGAPIPIGTCRSYSDRAILLGDAAGHVKPLTGGGIVWGMRCADVAARAIERAFDARRFDSFFWRTEYERVWKGEIGGELRKQLMARRVYSRLDNARIDKLFEIMKPRMENIAEFDYDDLGVLVGRLPKLSLIRAVLPSLFGLTRNLSAQYVDEVPNAV